MSTFLARQARKNYEVSGKEFSTNNDQLWLNETFDMDLNNEIKNNTKLRSKDVV